MESEPARPSSETILESQGYFTPESVALAQTVDDLDNKVFKKWKVENDE